MIRWTEAGRERTALWRSALGVPPPEHVVVAGDDLKAATACRLAREGTALLWRGDFHNARTLLAAMGRRCPPAAPGSGFEEYRRARSRRARTLGMLLVPYAADHVIPLRRAPDVRAACAEVFGGPSAPPAAGPLRELLGLIGAHEWRRKGVYVPALGARVHPHHGVFSPVRGEYVDLVAGTPLPADRLAFDVGTGTGVLAAVLARRGVRHVVATDLDPVAVACAEDNVARLGLRGRVEVVLADLFPPGRAPLVVCNPPWLPAEPASPLDRTVYDPGGRMLRGFLDGLAGHLEPGGEAWLILSDLAEHLGLRGRGELAAAFGRAGLRVAGRRETVPRHRRPSDPRDPLHAARAAEVTTLWRLRLAAG
ncbi:50S ribosomal protein L11 methyltransferase [Nonomuraea sp. NPDC050783]|uniref:50S ribosomal protein L11 methyltransferase n=1 Tax=Nonomuraea sp. NPDC050783 TaxID=3154634 RepID=UPI003467DC96